MKIKIVLLEAVAGPLIDADTLASEPDPVLRPILAGSREIEHFPGCRRLELIWKSYIGYSAIAVGDRRRFAEYSSSQYLEYLEVRGICEGIEGESR